VIAGPHVLARVDAVARMLSNPRLQWHSRRVSGRISGIVNSPSRNTVTPNGANDDMRRITAIAYCPTVLAGDDAMGVTTPDVTVQCDNARGD